MQYVLIIHEVEDYKKWKAAFDNAAGILTEAGELCKRSTNPTLFQHLPAR